MRVSPDGNTRFARQENGQVFADGDEQKPGPVSGVAAGICVVLLTRHNGYELSRQHFYYRFESIFVFLTSPFSISQLVADILDFLSKNVHI